MAEGLPLQSANLLVMRMPSDGACWQGLVTQWDGAEAELGALQGEAVLRIASAIKVFEDKLQLCAPRLLLAVRMLPLGEAGQASTCPALLAAAAAAHVLQQPLRGCYEQGLTCSPAGICSTNAMHDH